MNEATLIATAAGDILGVAGAKGKEVFPRSSIKLIQALPLIETGAADRYADSNFDSFTNGNRDGNAGICGGIRNCLCPAANH